MDEKDLIELIGDIQKRKIENEDIEVKSGNGGLPMLEEALSAFSNHKNGGIIVLGLDEKQNFKIVGVNDTQNVQTKIADLARNSLYPALDVRIKLLQIDGKNVIIVEVPEIPNDKKPCYKMANGMYKGSYKRIGNSNRRMSDYEIQKFENLRNDPKDDARIIEDASMDDLDTEKIKIFFESAKKTNQDPTKTTILKGRSKRTRSPGRSTACFARPWLAC